MKTQRLFQQRHGRGGRAFAESRQFIPVGIAPSRQSGIPAARQLADDKGAWKRTALAVFHPAEETGEGARAMIEDGLARRFPRTDVVLGQHLVPAPAGARER